MKIIQITDLHLGTAEEKPYGVDVRQNFLDTLQAVRERSPDYIIITGDLCLDIGVRETYEWIKGRMDLMGIPYEVQSGNHDDTRMLAEVFGIEALMIGKDLFYKKHFGEYTLYFLDTSSYMLSQQQMTWLSDELRTASGDIYLFIHHPPIYSGVPFMDNDHPLKNRDELTDLLLNVAHPIHAFCGHYHVDKVIRKANLTTYITPSLYFQINDGFEAFELDHKRIGFREIILEHGILQTGVRYI